MLAADPHLSLDEVITTGILIAVAGHETTANLLGAAMIRLLTPAPDGSRLAETFDPDHPGAFTELLRLDSPVQATARTATTDHRIDGVDIRCGKCRGLPCRRQPRSTDLREFKPLHAQSFRTHRH